MHSKSNHSQRCSRGLWPIKRYARTDHLYLATTILVYEYFVHNTRIKLYTSIVDFFQNVIVYCGWHVLTSINNDSLEPSIKSKYNTNESPSRQRDVGLWHRRYIYQTGNHLHADCREKRCSNSTTNHRESGLLRQMACVQTDSAETRSSTWNSSLYLINFHI